MEPIMSLNWSAVALAACVASPACAAYAVARSQARTRVGCQRPAMFEVMLGVCREFRASAGRERVPDDVTGFVANPASATRRSIRVLDVGLRTVAAGGRLGVPMAFFVFVFDALSVPGHALLGGGR